MSIWLVYFGEESGNREDCNVFYEVPEAYTNQVDAQARVAALKAAHPRARYPEFWTHMIGVNVVK